MNTNLKEDEMLNCPDCQLQTLQQQQQQQQQQSQFPGPASHPQLQINSIQHPNPQEHPQFFHSSRNSLSCDLQNHIDFNNVRSNAVGGNVAYQTKGHQISVSGVPYKNSDGSSGPSCLPVSNTMAIVAVPMLSGSACNAAPINSTDMLVSNNACLTPLPMEGCDISGYCTTYTVLDLPTNDKYYIPTLPRHSVFPPMFYAQAPTIPGYSPIPDCNIWGNCNSNDFGYSYPTYPQQTTASANDFYSTTASASSTLPNIHSPSESSNPNQTHLMNSCSFSFSNNNGVLDGNECFKKSDVTAGNSITKKSHFAEHSPEDDDDSMIPICISSSSEDTSDSGSYISQREVIVEDDDDNSESMSMCHMDGSPKCTICQNPVMADCPSPQLANILENIHEDITAEDLDITVSSGDIEIGGIEDEVRDFHPKKSSLQNGTQIPLSRLAYLLNIPLEILLSLNENSNLNDSQDSGHREQDLQADPITQTAVLCSKCNKLATTIDSLEKQLRNTCTTLKEFFQPQILLHQNQSQNKIEERCPCNKIVIESLQKVQTIPSETCKSVHLSDRSINRENDQNRDRNEVDPQQKCYSKKQTDCKLTQTELLLPLESLSTAVNCSNDCIMSFENMKSDNASICSSLFQCVRVRPTCSKDTMTDCDPSTGLCNSVDDQTRISTAIDSRDQENRARETSSKPGTIGRTENDENSCYQMNLEYGGTLTSTSCNSSSDSNSEDDSDETVSSNSPGDPENFDGTSDSSIGNINLECDIHNISCSFISELQRREEKKELAPNLITSVGPGQGQDEDISQSAIADTDKVELELDTDAQLDSYLCEECGKILSSKRTFETHAKRHRNDLTHKCSNCGKGFVNEASLEIHMRTHTGEKPFPCSRCGKAFATKSNMVSHQDICKENKNKTSKRGGYNGTRANNSKNSLLSSSSFKFNSAGHPNRESSVKLCCHTCGLCFRLKERLEIHLLKGCNSKVLECSHCKKKFSKHSEMKVHMLIHNGEKPYVCDVCGISFSTKGNQISHSRTHSVDKRFKCEICDKGFNRKQALQLHSNRHNGIKPFTCEICDRKFYDPSNLQNHKKTHSKKNS